MAEVVADMIPQAEMKRLLEVDGDQDRCDQSKVQIAQMLQRNSDGHMRR